MPLIVLIKSKISSKNIFKAITLAKLESKLNLTLLQRRLKGHQGSFNKIMDFSQEKRMLINNTKCL